MKLTTLLLPCMLVSTGLILPAQWIEVGDAGQTPGSAQRPLGGGPLFSIAGTVGFDADMYLIRIDDAFLFDATTVGGAAFDTQLFLFRTDGTGVTHDDDDPAGGTLQSRITGAFVPSPELYLLAITRYGGDPQGQGKLLWNNVPFNVERPPDGPGRLEELDSWTPGNVGGPYTINLLGCSFPGKEVCLPDNHHLTESPVQVGGTGSTAWWQTGGGRFQILYEGSHFTSRGVNGLTFIEKIAFRGEDGEPNLGGQLWNNVTVQLAETTLTAASMYTAFAQNMFPPPPDTTIPGPPGFFNDVFVWRSDGSHPNNTNIYLDLTMVGAMIPYDPTGPLPNLLIDVTLPIPASFPPSVGPVMQMQDTSGSPAFIRGAGVNTPIPFSPTGNYSNVPPVVYVNLQGPGATEMPIPAHNEFYGNGCGGLACSFYQSFLNGQVFDLTGLTLTPDNAVAPLYYNVTAGAPAFDPTKVNAAPNSIADEATVLHPLGFAFGYPTGVSIAIQACTNGYVWLNGTTTKTDASPTVGELLGATANDPARLAPCWYDFHAGNNVPTHPNAGLHVLTDTSGGLGSYVCYVTWFNVGIWDSVSGAGVGGHAVHDMQLVLYEATGVVEFRYGPMPHFSSCFTTANPSNPAIVGFSLGRHGGVVPSVDPQSRDLSMEIPFSTTLEGPFGHMGQTATASVPGGFAYSGRMWPGQAVTWNANNVPPTTLIGLQLLDFVASVPGATPLGLAPGCVISTGPSPAVLQLFIAPPAAVTGTVPLIIPPGFDGLNIYAQFITFDANGRVYSSNALEHKIGLY